MAFKRQVDRLPIIPADATRRNVTCHFCIVGCGYHAYTWPVNRQGGPDPAQNVFKTDLSRQQPPDTEAWYAPSMYNVVQQNGQEGEKALSVARLRASCSDSVRQG